MAAEETTQPDFLKKAKLISDIPPNHELIFDTNSYVVPETWGGSLSLRYYGVTFEGNFAIIEEVFNKLVEHVKESKEYELLVEFRKGIQSLLRTYKEQISKRLSLELIFDAIEKALTNEVKDKYSIPKDPIVFLVHPDMNPIRDVLVDPSEPLLVEAS